MLIEMIKTERYIWDLGSEHQHLKWKCAKVQKVNEIDKSKKNNCYKKT